MSERTDRPEQQAKPAGPPPRDPKAADGERPLRRKISQDSFETIRDAHKEWIESGGDRGTRADLSFGDLEGVDLQGANLLSANLQEVDLGGSSLRGANLWSADLHGANLRSADLRQANLAGADLQDASLTKANLQGANLSWAKLQDANLFDAELQGASLVSADLQRANLASANLRGAGLVSANLRGANLAGASLQGARLWEANLQEADLQRANLERLRVKEKGKSATEPRSTDVRDADFRNSDLRDAKLSEVGGLLPERLAGANLANAVLPADIAGFDTLRQVEDTSKSARKIYLGMLFACAYSWLTVAATTDAQLLNNASISPLPIIRTEVPIAEFYGAGSLLLLGIYVYLHLYLMRLWRCLAALPAIFPDGRALDERAYPWQLNGLVRAHFALLRGHRPALSRLADIAATALAWWVVPVTLLAFWLRYLPRQDWIAWHGTGAQIACILMAAGFGALSYLLARRTLRGQNRLFPWRTPWRDGRSYTAAATVLLGIVLSHVSVGAIDGVRLEVEHGRADQPARAPVYRLFPGGREIDPDFADVRVWLPYALGRLGYDPFADLRGASVSTRPDDWWMAEIPDGVVQAADLRGASLRQADASGAFLAKADLRAANLRGAKLRRADLRGADLGDAGLQEADLERANLQGASLERADLRGANLARAQLQGTDLRDADLRQARFWPAGLDGPDFLAEQRQACERLTAAENWSQALRDEALACGAALPESPSGAPGPAPNAPPKPTASLG